MSDISQPTIIQETSDYYVIDKPAGFSVEPHPTYPSISQWLDTHYHIYAVQEMDRFGVVHRLDVETSGVLVWAKNLVAQQSLQTLWQGRAVKKTYLAVTVGETLEHGSIEWSIERDGKKDKQRVTLLPSPKSRIAITEYRRLDTTSFKQEKVSLVECLPLTGRTHQIRVHLNSIGHPIIGDSIYGSKLCGVIATEIGLKRHWLHAWKIALDGQSYQSSLPHDLQDSMKQLGLSLTD